MSELILRYEQLDRAIIEGMLSTEKSCCQSKQGYACSLKLVKARKLVWCWEMRKSLVWNKVDFAHLQSLAMLLEVKDDVRFTVLDIDKNLIAAQKALKL
eukprot:2289594-Ditylum_brightwellii.AAC.1